MTLNKIIRFSRPHAQKMGQPDSFSVKCSIPIYAITSPNSNDFIYAGGGGQSKSGIANAIVSDVNNSNMCIYLHYLPYRKALL